VIDLEHQAKLVLGALALLDLHTIFLTSCHRPATVSVFERIVAIVCVGDARAHQSIAWWRGVVSDQGRPGVAAIFRLRDLVDLKTAAGAVPIRASMSRMTMLAVACGPSAAWIASMNRSGE